MPLTLYSEPSPRQILLVTSIVSFSLKILGAFLALLSKSIVTSAISHAGLSSVPLKITSSNSLPLICFGESSPITNLKASTRFDLPHPFGPTIPVKPFSIKISVGSTKDLKPLTLRVLKLIINYCDNILSMICLNSFMFLFPEYKTPLTMNDGVEPILYSLCASITPSSN